MHITTSTEENKQKNDLEEGRGEVKNDEKWSDISVWERTSKKKIVC